MRDILNSIFVSVGTIIGAGFASGQEINQFFNSYGIKGLFGLIISMGILAIIIFRVISIASKKKLLVKMN